MTFETQQINRTKNGRTEMLRGRDRRVKILWNDVGIRQASR